MLRTLGTVTLLHTRRGYTSGGGSGPARWCDPWGATGAIIGGVAGGGRGAAIGAGIGAATGAIIAAEGQRRRGADKSLVQLR
jgi:hypothetical protein